MQFETARMNGMLSILHGCRRRYGQSLLQRASFAASTKVSNEGRLPAVLWKPEDEFSYDKRRGAFVRALNRGRQVSFRILKFSMSSILKPLPLFFLGTCSSAVMGVGMYEATLFIDPLGDDPLNKEFIVQYALENFLSSCVWESKPPELIAQSLGLCPDTFLKEFGDSAEDAVIQLQLLGCETYRSLFAGVMVITQLINAGRASYKALDVYAKQVLTGKEPPLRGVTERVIRLSGAASDVTELSMQRYGAHIMPVFEVPERIQHLILRWSKNGSTPCVWKVEPHHYGSRHTWERLDIDSSYMLRATTGRLILCVEADATNADEALDFGTPCTDLDLEDATQAFRMIERKAAQKIPRPFRMLRVFLGDSLQESIDGGLHTMTLRERIARRREADVLIDAKAPLIIAILKWCERVTSKAEENGKKIAIDASSAHFKSLKILLSSKGFEIYEDLDNGATQNGSTKSTIFDIPHLIYHSSTASTVNAVYALISAGRADPAKCCVLINSPFGLEHLEDLKDITGYRFEAICAGQIYDDYLRQVRVWARMGYSSANIQKELDLRFEGALKIQQDIKKKNSTNSE